MAAGVYDYFVRACRRGPMPEAGIAGEEIRDAEGNSAVFRIAVVDGRVETAQFRCTTCVTLVGFCEHLCDLIRCGSIAEARAFSAPDLLALHHEVPVERRDRARLAVAAMHSAVQRSFRGERA